MIRIAALNDSTSESDSDDGLSLAVGTKEAEESEAYMLYNKALSLLREDIHKAEDAFEQLLCHGFIREAAKLVENETEGAIHPGLQLLYSIYKNLAVMSLQKGDHKTAMEWYIEAVKVDETEVTVWYKIGTIALKLHNYQLARLGFEQGLQCNPNHWPCLDNVITVLYTINDYFYCLYYISKALEKDHQYTKGIAFRNQIMKEQPSLKEYTSQMFTNCDHSINFTRVDKEESDEYINEALTMREKRREMAAEPQKKSIKLPQPIQSLTWKSVGESLLALYFMIKKSDPPMSMGLRIDLSDHVEDKVEEVTSQEAKSEEDMETDKSVTMVTTTSPTTSSSATENKDVTSKSEGEMVVSGDGEAMDTTTYSSSPVTITTNTVTTKPLISSQEGYTSVTATPPTMAQSVASALQDHPGFGSGDFDNRNRPQKRKRGITLDDQFGKRRSARVRNTFKSKEEEKVNFQEMLLNFLPSSLKQVSDEEEMDVIAIVSDVKNQGETTPVSKIDHNSSLPEATVMLKTSEQEDVKKFLESEQENGGCLCLMQQYVLCLASKYNRVWPRDLIPIFLRVYSQVRKHFDLPCLFSKDDTDEYLVGLGQCCLLCVELQLDCWTQKNIKPGNSPRSSGHSSGSQILHSSDLSAHHEDDMCYITGLTAYCDVLGDYWYEHCTRVYWMKARLYMAQGQTEDALYCFQKTKEYLEMAKEQNNTIQIQLWNCVADNVITVEQVENQHESLQRSQSAEEAQSLYKSGDYEKVADFLLKAFSQPQQKEKVSKPTESGTGVPERLEQLLLLQECLLKLKNYQKGLYWGEIAFDEALKGYKKATTSASKEDWSKCMTQIWMLLLRNLERDEFALKGLPSSNLVRLSQNLVFVIDTMMSVPDIATDMPIGSVLPFMLLYRVINHEEQRIKSMKPLEGSGAGDMENAMPSSLMLLNMAHDYLGRHSWCTKSDGALLLFFKEVLGKEMKEKTRFKDEFKQAYEQCVYCMYGHPNKKAKARHLIDHNAPQIELKWEEAKDIFEYFKPNTVPEFDSFKTDTVSAELEFLLKRIAQLVPEKEKPSHVMDSLNEYIDGNTKSPPSITKENYSTVSKELYYLLGDYYFKNQEHAKAIKFYMFDICINPQRLDSWAGLGLARMSQLEQKLNSTELRMDVPIHKKSIAALRCFGHSVEIEDASGKLWMEYGSLSYQLHSHSSRQLKYHEEKLEELGNEVLDEDLIQIARDYRQEMLQSAFNCYKNASECEDEESEEWLTQYMMGKSLEKMKKPPKEFLEHYKLAADALHEENATYPKKITYAYTAHTSPRLAVEALEMFYRLHVSILKILLTVNNKADLQLYKKYVDEAANTPFAQGREKKDENRDGDTSTADDGNSQQRKSKSTTSQQDHTYSKQKNSSNMMELSMNETTSDVQGVDVSKTNLVKPATDSADSLDGKGVNSVENSCSSSEYFPSAESEVSSESNGEEVDKVIAEPFCSKFPTSDNSLSLEMSSSQMVPSSNVMELSAEVLDNMSSQSSNSNSVIKLIVTASAPKQTTPTPGTVSTKGPEDVDGQQEESLQKQRSLGFVVRQDTSESNSLSVIEDEDGTLTVKAKIQNIEPGMPIPQVTSDITKSQEVKSQSEVKVKEDVNLIEIFSSPEPVPGSSDEADVNIQEDEGHKSNIRNRGEEDMDVSSENVKQEVDTGNEPEEVSKGESKNICSASEIVDQRETTQEDQTVSEVHCADEVIKESETGDNKQNIKPVVETDRDQKESTTGITPAAAGDQDMETTLENQKSNSITDTDLTDKGKDQDKIQDTSNKVKEEDKEFEKLDTPKEGSKHETLSERVSENEPKGQQVRGIAKVDNSVSTSAVDLGDGEISGRAENKNVGSEDMNKQSKDIEMDAEEINLEAVLEEVDVALSQEIKEKILINKEDDDAESKTSSKTDCSPTAGTVAKQGNETISESKGASKSDAKIQEKDQKESAKSTDAKASEPSVTGDEVRKDLIEKCMAALHLCLSRFPTHYKSLYRLAYVYFHSPYHKNLRFARDLLLGTHVWQNMSHMPAPGLFSERKVANFFQGTWRLPIGEVERSGSFATHLNKAVFLLLKILREQTDVSMLYHIHLQLNRTPDAGKKYLRDGERLHYSVLAFDFCLDAIKSRISQLREMTDKEKSLKLLMETYRIWNYGISKQKAYVQRVNNLFAATFKAVMKGEANPDRPLLDQAIKYCQSQQQMTSVRQHHPSGGRSNQDSNMSKDGSQSDSSIFSPERPLSHQLSVSSPVSSQPNSPMKSNLSKSLMASSMSPVKSAGNQLSNLSPQMAKSANSSQGSASRDKYDKLISSSNIKSGEISASLLLSSMISANIKSSEKESAPNKEPSVTKSQKTFQTGAAKGMSPLSQSRVVTSLQKQFRTSANSDISPPQVKTPGTPVLEKKFDKIHTPVSEKPSGQKLSLSSKKPKTVPVVAFDVIEISSSSDEEVAAPPRVEEKLDGNKGSLPKKTENVKKSPDSSSDAKHVPQKSTQSESKNNTEKRVSEEIEMAVKRTDNTTSVNTKSGTNTTEKSENLDKTVPEKKEDEKVIEAEEKSDQASADEGPSSFLDPTTGLFVTDSDSQNSVYVANPENLSFDVDEMMDVDN